MPGDTSELPRPLSAKYKGDFAYPTIKDRIPVILTKIVDHVSRLKSDPETKELYGEGCTEDLKQICGGLSKLKNEIQTDKPLVALTDNGDDVADWEEYRTVAVNDEDGQDPRWFRSPWMYTECYFYRRVNEIIRNSSCMKEFDPFRAQKQVAFSSSFEAIRSHGEHILRVIKEKETGILEDHSLETIFSEFLQVCLWGNKCDLSISAGSENFQSKDAREQLEHLKPFLLSNSSQKIWKYLLERKENSSESRIDIILDNAGFELFTDLCLAEFLVSFGFAKRINFHAKSMPWFVSDVTENDFQWTLNQLENAQSSSSLQSLGKKWLGRIQDGSWRVLFGKFWTLPHDFAKMQKSDPDLYADLSKSDLLIFKGDLNYRKLTGDLAWQPSTSLEMSLRGFLPTSLCTLRTLKCDLVVGLEPGLADKTKAKDDKWQINGNWAVLQFCLKH